MAGLVNPPWNDSGVPDALNDDELAARIGAMGIKDLKVFLSARNVTPDKGIVEKSELRSLAYAAAGVQRPLPSGWARYESDGKAYYHNTTSGETTWTFPEAPAAAAVETSTATSATTATEETAAAADDEAAVDDEAAANEGGGDEEEVVDWKTLSVKELKQILSANGLSTKGFAEKGDFVALATENESWIQPHLAWTPSQAPSPKAPSPSPRDDSKAVASTRVNLGPAFNEGKARAAQEAGIVERPAEVGNIADGGWQIDVFGTKRGRCLDNPNCIRFTPRNMRVNNCGMGNAAVTCQRCGLDNLRHVDLGKWEEGEPHMVNERGEGVRFG